MTNATQPEHSAETSLRLVGRWLAVTGRAMAVILLIAGACVIAWACAQAFMALADSANPDFSTGVAFGSILALGMFCVSQVQKLHALAEGALSWVKDASSRRGKYLRQGAGYLALETFLIAFPICLAILTFHWAEAGEPPPTPPASEPQIDFVHAVYYRQPEKRLAVFLPYLVFRPGSLADPDRPQVDSDLDPSELSAELFADGSYSITGKGVERLENYIIQLADTCEATDIDPISITVYGFASDAPFLDGKRQPRPDSKTLNMHLANLRASFVVDSIRRFLSRSEPLRSAINVRRTMWETYHEMMRFRNRRAFQSFQFAISEYTDHRSAMLFLHQPSRCPSLYQEPDTT